MPDNFSDILRNWIPEALDGNVEYFKQLKKYRILDRCKDEYGMTPLMYAVLGKGYLDRDLLLEFAKLCEKSARNCLGHTACDIYICVADPMIFSDTQYRDIFNALDPSNTASKEAAKGAAGGIALGLIGLGAAAFAALTYMGADSTQRANMDAAYRRNSEQARFSSYGTAPIPKSRTAESDSYRERYTSKFCTEQRERLSRLEEQLASKEKELAGLQDELENVGQRGAEIFREQCQEYREKRLATYQEEREKQRQQILHTTKKDEFETQAEYHVRIDRIMDERFGPEASDEELCKIRSEDLHKLRTRAKEILEQKRQEIEGKVLSCEQDIHTLELQLDLLDIYAFPFSGVAGAYISLGTYDAENECFTLNTCRHETLIHIPRETARIIRQDSDSYTIQHDWDCENLDYYAEFIIQTEDQSYVSEMFQCSILSGGDNANT